MQRKFRLTGFTRFFLVMIIVAPLAYLAASYYNGEDGIANIKRLLRIETDSSAERFVPSRDTGNETLEGEDLEKELEAQQKRLEELKAENERLRKEVNEKEQELSNLKNQ